MDIECRNSQDNDEYREMVSSLRRQLDPGGNGVGRKPVESIRLSTDFFGLGFTNKRLGPEGDDILSLQWSKSFYQNAEAIPLLFPPFLSIISTISPAVVDMDLDFNEYSPLSDSQIVQLLLPFTNLQVLHITESWTLDRLLFVFDKYDERHETTLLPALRLLSFNKRVNVRLSHLLHFLRRRSESKFPISTIKIRGSSGKYLKQALEGLGICIEI